MDERTRSRIRDAESKKSSEVLTLFKDNEIFRRTLETKPHLERKVIIMNEIKTVEAVGQN